MLFKKQRVKIFSLFFTLSISFTLSSTLLIAQTFNNSVYGNPRNDHRALENSLISRIRLNTDERTIRWDSRTGNIFPTYAPGRPSNYLYLSPSNPLGIPLSEMSHVSPANPLGFYAPFSAPPSTVGY